VNCQDKVALVTGAAGKGMGRSIALTLAREGAKVVVNYRTSRQSAEAIVEHVASRGGEAIAAQADVFTAEGCQSLVKSASDRFGRIDICILGPGAGWHPEPPDRVNAPAALDDARAELAPIYHLLPRVLPGMYERKWGRVIGISLLPPFESPAYAYNVAKAARTGALLQMRGAAWKRGVAVNVIAPGPVDGIETLAQAVEQCDHGPAWTARKNTSPQDIAEGVAFLCSEAGAFVSGCELTYLYASTPGE
jgi:NAD(P)-dependent dehydrogenase (short-subunit alcohol dehydrogenase family)